jgi:hypothetical protein
MAHPTLEPVTGTVTPARTLRDAAQYLARYGWMQGGYYDATATVFTPAACLVGAIGMVCYGGPVDAPAQAFDDPGFGWFEAANTFIDAYLAEVHDAGPGERYTDAYAFNDAHGRTAEEVIATLRAAANYWDRAHVTVRHADESHEPGTVLHCLACEAECHCGSSGMECVYCAIEAGVA